MMLRCHPWCLCLGVDAAAHTTKHRHGAATKAIAGSTIEEDLPVIVLRVHLVEQLQNPEDSEKG